MIKPMLAHEYDKRGKSIHWPAWVQPKLDGIRVIAHRQADGVKYFSRLGNEFHTLGHLSQHICEMFPPDTYLDGEAYNYKMDFPSISSAVKRDVPNLDSKRIQLWVYDLITPLYFVARNRLLEHCAKRNSCDSPVVFLPAVEVKDEAAMKKSHALFTKNGFEGTIIRNANALYVHTRTVDLQKHKDFQDSEFEIVGSVQCTGKDAGMIKFLCVTDNGVEFDVEPGGSDDLRRRMWAERETFHGKRCTVKYQGFYPSGKPRFPTAAVVRDYE